MPDLTGANIVTVKIGTVQVSTSLTVVAAKEGPPEVDLVLVGPSGPALVSGGTTVSYEIRADDVGNLAAAQATITYDSTLWTVDGVQADPDFDGCLSTFNDGTPGAVVMGLVCTTVHTGAPLTLWVLTLTAADVVQDQQTQLAITAATLGTLNEEDIPAEGSTQDVTVANVVCGDLQPAGGDGDVDVFDALRTLKIAVDLVTADAREKIAGDVHPDNETTSDGDSDFDVLDALRVLKDAVGLLTITSCGGP